jgi:uncharacterized protein (DUF2141 family)
MALIAVGAAGCGRGEINGTVEAQNGVSLAGAVVVACHAPEGRCQSASRRSRAVPVQGNGPVASFRVPRLPRGEYIVIGLLDLNGNGKEDDGDLSGHHARADGTAALVRPPAVGVRVHLRQVIGTAASGARASANE